MSYPIINSSNAPMTVAELQEMPTDAVVITEGCDCDGKVEQVQCWRGNVYLKRSQHPYPEGKRR